MSTKAERYARIDAAVAKVLPMIVLKPSSKPFKR